MTLVMQLFSQPVHDSVTSDPLFMNDMQQNYEWVGFLEALICLLVIVINIKTLVLEAVSLTYSYLALNKN
jgi:hypothetical protein